MIAAQELSKLSIDLQAEVGKFNLGETGSMKQTDGPLKHDQKLSVEYEAAQRKTANEHEKTKQNKPVKGRVEKKEDKVEARNSPSGSSLHDPKK